MKLCAVRRNNDLNNDEKAHQYLVNRECQRGFVRLGMGICEIDRWCVQTDDDDANVRELDNGSMRAQQQFNVNVNSTTAQRSVVMTVSSTGLVVREGTRDSDLRRGSAFSLEGACVGDRRNIMSEGLT